MRRAIVALFVGLTISAACTTNEDPSALVDEADAMLRDGGIEKSKVRALAEQKYDRAIRIICGEEDLHCRRSGSGSAPGTPDYNLAHAHFGLAFARSFDLVERVKQLYESGTILSAEELVTVGGGASSGEEKAEDEAAQCEQRVNLPQLVPLLKTIIDTSLLPIVSDLEAVTKYAEFSMVYNKAFLDFGFLDPEAKSEMGFEFGEDDKGVPGKFTVAEAYAALALFRTLVVGAQAVFSFNDLTPALIVFAPKLDFSAGVRPYQLARLLNSDPCTPNPLFEASFGVLTEEGRTTFQSVRSQLGLLFAEQMAGFTNLQDNGKADAIINFDGSGAWGTNLLGRVRSGDPSVDRQLKTVGSIMTGLIPPVEVARLFESLKASLDAGKTFEAQAFIDGNEELKATLENAEIDLNVLGVPAVSFKLFFDNAIGDLKSIMPMMYAESEPILYEYTKADDVFSVDEHEKPLPDAGKTIWWRDVNGDRRVNQRGDFIVHLEREVFVDSFNDDAPLNHEATQSKDGGILGTFWDADFSGVPDGDLIGVVPGRGPAGQAVTYATDRLYMAPATDDEASTYRDYFDANKELSNGCLDYAPLAQSRDWAGVRKSCEVEVGDLLGHVWPSVYPEPYAAPMTTDGRRKDPANGVVDRIYMFYPNPSLNGSLQRKTVEGKYRPFANEDFNRFVTGVLSVGEALDRLAANQK